MSDLSLNTSLTNPEISVNPIKLHESSQGQILTENPDLLKLLTENSTNSQADKPLDININNTVPVPREDTHVNKEESETDKKANKELIITDSSKNKNRTFVKNNSNIKLDTVTNKNLDEDNSHPQNISTSSDVYKQKQKSPAANPLNSRNNTRIQSFVNPEILKATGQFDVNYHFPKYVSLKSSSQVAVGEETDKSNSSSPVQEESNKSVNSTKYPASIESNFCVETAYPSFEKDRSSSRLTVKDKNSESVEENFEFGKQYLLVPVKSESPKFSSQSQSEKSGVEEILNMSSTKPRRIYIEPPDPDEDDDIRFVSSRIDEYDDKDDTYRQLDEAAVGESELRPERRGKHVRYEDTDRYEDRSQLPAVGPIKGVPLPISLKTDPKDIVDLHREEEYQNSLKQRVKESEKHVTEIEVPKLPLSPENNEEFPQDSLDYSEETYRINQSNMVRDSLDLYNGLSMKDQETLRTVNNTAWNNPPPQPYIQQPPYNDYGQENVYMQQEGPRYTVAGPPGFCGDSWQETAFVQRGDVLERYDVTVEQQFMSHQTAMSAGDYEQVYVQPGDEVTYSQEKFGGENPGNKNYSSPQYIDKTEDNNEPQHPKEPEKPQYDYVSNNKYDYGRQPRRTYRQIQELKNEEKIKLESVFIKPKLKKNVSSKLPVLNKTQQAEGQKEQDQYRNHSNKASSVENLWDNRSAFLADHKSGKMSQKKKLEKYPSESRLNTKKSEAAKDVSPTRDRVMPFSAPFSPGKQHLLLKPITQEIVTDDGQKIIVDVNLRLSPGNAPPGDFLQFGSNPPPAPYTSGFQYDVNDSQQQQYMPRETGSNEYKPHIGYAAQSVEFKENRDAMSPYSKIPPIPKSSDSHTSQFGNNLDGPAWKEVESDEEGYAAQFKKSKLKQKEKPWYTIYNLEDYRRMQKEVRLGTLGPDLDNASYRERMEKRLRQEEYARQVKLKNQKILASKKPPPFPRPKETDDIINKRKLAVEYAKHVPKPSPKPRVTKYNSYELAAQLSPSPKHRSGQETLDIIDLDKLQQRHERDKQNVALIRQNLATDRAVSQNA